MNKQSLKMPHVTLTISCPFDLFVWLKRNQQNVSYFVVQAIEAEKTRSERTEPSA